jgi:hypothetical protein
MRQVPWIAGGAPQVDAPRNGIEHCKPSALRLAPFRAIDGYFFLGSLLASRAIAPESVAEQLPQSFDFTDQGNIALL